ncbi:hypothetical protein ACIQLK_02560 [Microbacterium sp. NPDC091382]|uniref:hypothetical protein n=1 Tax=Microbacterium sp. NPDC091382 TaxID=3364210 RepID=UPI00380FE785
MSARILIADLDIRGERDLSWKRVAASLSARRVPAVVTPADSRIIARVGTNATGRIILADAAGGLLASDAAELVSALAEEWRADVRLERGDTVLAASTRRPGAAPRVPVQEPTEVNIIVIGGIVPIDPQRRRGLASQLECSLSVLPAGDMHLVQTHGDPQMDWPAAQRPVVRLTSAGDMLFVEVYSRGALEDEPVETRWAMRGIPDMTVAWRARWERVLADEGEVADVQRMLGRAELTSSTLRGPRHPDHAFSELATDAASVDALRDHPNDTTLFDAAVTTLNLPAETALLLRGRVGLDDLPGAQHIERTNLGRSVWDQVHPDRPSVWTRIVRAVRRQRPGNDEGPGDRGRTGPS